MGLYSKTEKKELYVFWRKEEQMAMLERGQEQRQNNLGSVVALLPRKFL